MTSHPLSLLAAAALSLGAAASAQAAPTTIEPLQASTPVAAYAGTAMWSRLDAATGKYQLVKSVDGGAATVVPVAQSAAPFDVDLGTNRSASTYAVYSRAGDLYRLNPKTDAEEKLTKLSSPTLAEHDPTIQRGRIAFLRTEGGYEQLRIGDTTTGSKGTTFVLKSRTLQSAELSNQQLAYVDRAGNKQRFHIRNIASGTDKVAYQVGSGGASFAVVSKPAFTTDGTSFVFASTRIGNTGSRIVKSSTTGKLSYAVGSPRYASVGWLDEARGALVSTSLDATPSGPNNCQDAGTDYCNVLATGPVAFDLAP